LRGPEVSNLRMTSLNRETATKPTSIILCGGKESRFGGSKSTACVGGITVMERIIRVLEPLSREIIAVTSPEKRNLPVGIKARIVTDRYPGKGPLGGIYTGLLHTKSHFAIAVACDMPFLNAALLSRMLDIADGFDVVVPRLEGTMVEPLHAIYARSCIHEMKARIESGQLSIAPLFGRLRVRYVTKEEYLPFDPRMLSFFNINYPEDFERANRLAAQLDAVDASMDEPSKAEGYSR